MDSLDLTGLDLPGEEEDCDFTLGAEDGTFDLTTYQNHQTGEFTFVTANFRNFHPEGGEESFGLRFDDGELDNEINWFPANAGDITSLTGNMLTWSVSQNSGEVLCNGETMHAWKISAQREEPM